MIDSIDRGVSEEVAQLRGKPLDLLVKMKRIEKSTAVIEQMNLLGAHLLCKKKDYNKLHSEIKGKEVLLTQLKEELDRQNFKGTEEKGLLLQLQELKDRHASIKQSIAEQELYSRTLLYMKIVRQKNLSSVGEPLAQLRKEIAHTAIKLHDEDKAYYRQVKNAKGIRQQHLRLRKAVQEQEARRQKIMEDDVEVIRKQKEFLAYCETYRELKEAEQKVDYNERHTGQLQKAMELALDFETVAKELTEHKEYIQRAEDGVNQLRKSTYITKADDIANYFQFLQGTKQDLNLHQSQIQTAIAHYREDVTLLSRQLQELREQDRDQLEGLKSSRTLEDTLLDKELKLASLQLAITQKESDMAEACGLVSRLFHILSLGTDHIYVKGHQLPEKLAELQSQLEAMLQ